MSRPSSHEPPTRRWLVRGFHGFKLVIGYALLAILIILAGVAIVRLVLGLWSLLLADFVDGFGFTEASYGDFQTVFGMIITLLIAMELLHTVVYQFILRHKLSMLLRVFLVITLLALARKLLLIDAATVSAYVLFALAAAVPLIATALWLLDDTTRWEWKRPSNDTTTQDGRSTQWLPRRHGGDGVTAGWLGSS